MTLEQLAKQGRRTAAQTTAATITSKMSQIRKESIKQAFCDFENVKYRYEHVDVIDGVTYYDDSAACSTEAAWFSFDNMNEPVIWITYANNNDCEDLVAQVKRHVKGIICIGGNAEKFHKVYDEILSGNVVECESLEKAVRMAAMMADYGDSVMLSPATHSNADYSSYMERGDSFKQYVRSLK
jgi:UDP-N-acetylmuramoylalanine--D-glutamate ligase